MTQPMTSPGEEMIARLEEATASFEPEAIVFLVGEDGDDSPTAGMDHIPIEVGTLRAAISILSALREGGGGEGSVELDDPR